MPTRFSRLIATAIFAVAINAMIAAAPAGAAGDAEESPAEAGGPGGGGRDKARLVLLLSLIHI